MIFFFGLCLRVKFLIGTQISLCFSIVITSVHLCLMKTLGFLMQTHIYRYFSRLYATHTFVYRPNHGLCWFLYIWSYMCKLTFLKNVIPTLPFSFQQGSNVFLGRNEVIYFSWYEGRNESLKFWGESSGAAVASLFWFSPQLSIFSLLACILDVNVPLTLHLVSTTGCLV